jgi:hypothetical protein
MPQILVAYVCFAARLQSLDFVKNYVAKARIFPNIAKHLGNFFAGILHLNLRFFHFFSFSLLTSAFSNFQKMHYIIYIYYNIYKFNITIWITSILLL